MVRARRLLKAIRFFLTAARKRWASDGKVPMFGDYLTLSSPRGGLWSRPTTSTISWLDLS
jgi:hypothetical protein